MIDKVNLSHLTFQEIARTLLLLTDEQFKSLAEGRARIEISFDNKPAFAAPVGKAGRQTDKGAGAAGPAVEEAAEAIKAMTKSDEVVAYLKANDRILRVAELRELAQLLGPTVSWTSKTTKPQLQEAIANGTAGYKEQSAVMLPGGFR